MMNTTPIWIKPDAPALVFAPMEGLADPPMRALMGEIGAFTFAVSEFLRVSADVPPARVFLRHVPELLCGGRTASGMPVQVQLLGGDPGRMAEAACVACSAGATAIDLNFGCPAPTVNRHDGGATLLKYPRRLRDIVAAVRAALPPSIPVSAKLRLGWDSSDAVFENAEMAAEGGADWLTIHGRTRAEGYRPPAHWEPIGKVREMLGVPVVVNGDLWSLDAFERCYEETGCRHFMLGRGALADPRLPRRAAHWLGIAPAPPEEAWDWLPALRRLACLMGGPGAKAENWAACRLKQWLKIASVFGEFRDFELIKRAETASEVFALLEREKPPLA